MTLPVFVNAQQTDDSPRATTQQPKLNHLAGERSTYLLSHATDPVEWYPWGNGAFYRAKAEDKPIFLSIGYAACHWCHVMQKETFENVEMARILNENYICVLVDREERPDLNHIYMGFTGIIAGTGGWPMTLFLTPDLKPFFAGGFFAPEPRYGKTGLKRLATELARIYKRERKTIDSRSQEYFERLSATLSAQSGSLPLADETISRTAGNIAKNYDPIYGGFGQRAKFPRPLQLSLLLRQFKSTGDSSYLRVVTGTLNAMSRGGIFDQLGGGFHRYTVDRRWRVPHFEKMLYDNALMAPVYCDAYRITRDTSYLTTVVRTLDFILGELWSGSGGFYASVDSDSEGEEGKYYTFTLDEIIAPESVQGFIRDYYDIRTSGEIEDRNVLYVSDSADELLNRYGAEEFESRLSGARETLLKIRAGRVKPQVDNNMLVSWNGLTLSALCNGYQVTGKSRYLRAAIENASLVRSLISSDGHLPHLITIDSAGQGLFLEDYAYYIGGLLELFQTDTSSSHFEWLELAGNLAKDALTIFSDESGKLYLREKEGSDLVMRPLNEADGSVPAPGSIFIEDLLMLYRMTGDATFRSASDRLLKGISGRINRSTSSMTSALNTLSYYLSDKIEILIVGKGGDRQRMIEEVQRRFIPGMILIVSDEADGKLPILEGRNDLTGKVTAYVCRNSQCELPVQTLKDLNRQLDGP